MASRVVIEQTPDWRDVMKRSVKRSIALMAALGLTLLTAMMALALASYQQTDPSFSTAAGAPVANWMGTGGAILAERGLYYFGLPCVLLLPFLFFTARRLWRNLPQPRWTGDALKLLCGMAFFGIAFTFISSGRAGTLPAGWGGLAGQLGHAALSAGFGLIPQGGQVWARVVTIVAGLGIGGWLTYAAMRVERTLFALPRISWPVLGPVLARGRVTQDDVPDTTTAEPVAAPLPRKAVKPDNRPPPEITDRSQPPAKATLGPHSRQGDFFGNYKLPELDLLQPADAKGPPPLDKMALERNARLLETVLDNFKVEGTINAVRPGPVVTMYELEPAANVIARRVISLAEDIARNMSALSARISTIPGRTVIGVELPNAVREPVVLHELIASNEFAQSTAQLPIVLGKDISGGPMIVDLAPMPHLLVAGTTGSGKSVGLNCMILSLLYRLTPDQCRMIMIDPKMLELSMYKDIPHLLSPVVTEPGKAIRALKWAVDQMDERYSMMSSIEVRNLVSFNEKVKLHKAKGKPLGKKVQIGFDPATGLPIFEDEQLEFEPLPQIVIIIDELADLMMTAGKEVEFLIKRLTQKARAAGIHVIMATQRPSVDVITGVIKANMPTRISFHVTSKIDSRTILGEQGAEQLLGKGDMLYMAGGSQVLRVHGPFVSDDEVRRVAEHWRAQGAPDYLDSVTEEPEDGNFAFDGQKFAGGKPEDEEYEIIVQLVCENQKASTSWIQRMRSIGYQKSARYMDRLEADGIISKADPTGRRHIHRDRDGNPV